MNSNGILHLTVSSKGLLRVWDSMSLAISGKKPDEVCVQISLTAPQIRTVLRAEQLAKQKAVEQSAVSPRVN